VAAYKKIEKGAGGNYIDKMHEAVRGQFMGATTLPSFLSQAGGLTREDRQRIVGQALVLTEQNYVHLPLKRAMYAIDPVQRLKLLLRRLEQTPEAELPSEWEFHREMTEIFVSMHDLHTSYLLPAPYNQMVSFLPFMIEVYFEAGQRRYMVSHVIQGFEHATFKTGVWVTYWNGVPIDRAVLNNAERYAGSNPDARRARGLETLTVRSLQTNMPPDEEWVVVGYIDKKGAEREIRLEWMVGSQPPEYQIGSSEPGMGWTRAMLGIDREQHLIQTMRKWMFAPTVIAASRQAAMSYAIGETFEGLESSIPDVFKAKEVKTTSGTFGYLRIYSFQSYPDDFVPEFKRLLTVLPQDGLIIDVRGNGGGYITNGERILQMLTPRRIEPEPVQFVNSPLNLAICKQNGPDSSLIDLSPWVESMQQALQTGSIFSNGYPLTRPEDCNDIGQVYFGPVVLIIDGLCYSTTDFFVAGFQDHQIGPVLGVDCNTGAGGANVWGHDLLQELLWDDLPGGGRSPFLPLPNQAGMSVAMRRSLRVGIHAGAPLEDLGVTPEARHYMTQADLLDSNVDLKNKAGEMLAAQRPHAFKATIQKSSPTKAKVLIQVKNIDRIDFYLDERPQKSLDVKGGKASYEVVKPKAGESQLEIRGFDGGKLAARYLEKI
jgi:hypothetical protein